MALSIRLGDARTTAEITRSLDREALGDRLQADRYSAAYALAQLDEDAWPEAEFYRCRIGTRESIVCHSSGGLGNATTLAGPADGVEAILQLHPGFPSTFAIAEPEHVDALERVYSFRHITRMMRMLVTRETFQPNHREAQPMLGAHVDLLNRLYNAEGDPTHYRREHIADGCYWGVVDEERLVAVAGTHAIGRSHSIAILGNVFTHPRFRGRGHATTATSAVTAALLEQVDEVVLSVDPENAPAIHAYRKLGYRYVGDIIEASATRHASTLMTAMRRWAARRRGPDGEQEVVNT
ncbi:MAG: GNAT family N-acetyltransferase [Chloroflexota bacterium]|nr:GNAT family N-acetyltransferase [Chloroflexota bacterium]MDE2895651.1 GNAT family N-acetyltransferase [Chloroflexota bacterium]